MKYQISYRLNIALIWEYQYDHQKKETAQRDLITYGKLNTSTFNILPKYQPHHFNPLNKKVV